MASAFADPATAALPSALPFPSPTPCSCGGYFCFCFPCLHLRRSLFHQIEMAGDRRHLHKHGEHHLLRERHHRRRRHHHLAIVIITVLKPPPLRSEGSFCFSSSSKSVHTQRCKQLFFVPLFPSPALFSPTLQRRPRGTTAGPPSWLLMQRLQRQLLCVGWCHYGEGGDVDIAMRV